MTLRSRDKMTHILLNYFISLNLTAKYELYEFIKIDLF